MTTTTYYKRVNGKKYGPYTYERPRRPFKVCDMPRIAKNVFQDDNNVTNTDQIIAVIAKHFGYTEIVSNQDIKTDADSNKSALVNIIDDSLNAFYSIFPELNEPDLNPPQEIVLTGDEALDKIAIHEYAVEQWAFVTITLNKGKVGSTVAWLIILSQLAKLAKDFLNNKKGKCNCVSIEEILRNTNIPCK